MARARDHRGRQVSKTFPTVEAARRWRAQVLVDKARGGGFRETRTTFAEFAVIVRDRSPHWRPGTVSAWDSRSARVAKTLGPRLLHTIKAGDIAEALAVLKAAGLADSTIAGTRNQIGSIMRAALADDLVARNPMNGLPSRKGTKVSKAKDAQLSPTQFAALYAALPERLRAYAITMATSGMRPAECAGITIDRLDLLHGTVMVDRQLVGTKGGRAKFGPPKTRASERTVYLADAAIVALEHHIATFPATVDGLVFSTPRNLPWSRERLGDAWRTAKGGLGLPADARGWHSLRHSFASAQVRGGVDVVSVAASIGHADAAMTLSVYAHSDEATVKASRNVAANDLLSASPAAG